jgi:hypothetical protein
MHETEREPDGAGPRAEPMDGAAFAAKVAAMSPTEREACFPSHSDGQVCR